MASISRVNCAAMQHHRISRSKSAQHEFDFEVKGFFFSKDVLKDIFSKDVLGNFVNFSYALRDLKYM